MEGHRVHGEVTAGEVFSHIGHKAYLVGMTLVGVGALDAVGGGLHGLARHDGGHGAVGRAGLVDLDAGRAQHAGRLLPGGRRRDVNVVALGAEKGVPHPTAHDPGLVPGVLKGADDGQGIAGYRGVYRGRGHAGLL